MIDEVREKIKEIEEDPRYSYPDAEIFINAPLALIQVDMKAKIGILKWVEKKMSEAIKDFEEDENAISEALQFMDETNPQFLAHCNNPEIIFNFLKILREKLEKKK